MGLIMRERVVAALKSSSLASNDYPDAYYDGAARHVLAALRKPTYLIAYVGAKRLDRPVRDIGECWEIMIDEALRE